MTQRIIGLLALLPIVLTITLFIKICGPELAAIIVFLLIVPLVISILIFLIMISTIYGICKIITG